MYKFFKKIYYQLPLKREIFTVVKWFYTPSKKTALYLKFDGKINVNIGNKNYRFLNKNTAIETLLFWRGIESHEPLSVRVWTSLVSDSKTVLDIGANSGVFSVLTSEFGPKNVKIIGFEPLPRIMDLYQTNLALNSIEATFVQKAVSNTIGKAVFFDMEGFDNQIGSLIKKHVENHKHHTSIQKIEVDVTTVDSELKALNVDSVDLIKIDVEGVEDQALSGMKNTLRKYMPSVLIEISNRETANNINEILDELKLGYILFEVREGKGLVKKKRVSKDGELNYLFVPAKQVEEITEYIVE